MSWFKEGIRLGQDAFSDRSWYDGRSFIGVHEDLIWNVSGYLSVHTWVEPEVISNLALSRNINLAVF